MHFDVYRGEGREWRFRLRADNNEIVATGEGYHYKKDCLDTIKVIKAGASSAPVVG